MKEKRFCKCGKQMYKNQKGVYCCPEHGADTLMKYIKKKQEK